MAGPGLRVAASCRSSSKGFGEGGREALGNAESISSAHLGARVAQGSAGWGRSAGSWTGRPAARPTVKEPRCLLAAWSSSAAWLRST